MERLRRFEWACLGVVAAAFAFRLYFVWHPYVLWDTSWYLLLARSFADHGDLRVPWTDPLQQDHYWPPLFPIVASLFERVLGPRYATIVVTSIVMSLALTVTTLFTTWDLFGRRAGFAAMATVAASPAFVHSDASGMSESTLALVVVLALWAYLRSLRQRAFLLLAALFALVAYFAKPNLGIPLVIAGLVPLAAWRVRCRGVRAVLRDPLDVTAGILLVGTLLGIGILRPASLGSVGIGVLDPVQVAVHHPVFFVDAALKLAFATAFLLVVAMPFSLRIRDALRGPWDEARGTLLIVVVLTLLATAIFTASFLLRESRELVDFDNIRYLTPAIVPFLWLTIPAWPLDEDAADVPRDAEGRALATRHRALYALAIALVVALLLLSPLAGSSSTTRLVLFVLLAIVPVAIAAGARASQFDVTEKRAASGPRAKVVRAKTRRTYVSGAALGLVVLVLGLASYYYSAWFLAVGVMLLVALAAQSPRAVVVAFACMMLVSAWPPYNTPFPAEDASAWLADHGLGNARVGVSEPIPYFAAVAPRGATLRVVDGQQPIPAGAFDALVLTKYQSGFDVANYSRVATFDYTFDPFPTLAARLAIERAVFGQEFDAPTARAIAIYLPNASSVG